MSNMETRIRALEESTGQDGEVYEDADGTRHRIPEGAHFIMTTPAAPDGERVSYTVKWMDGIDDEMARVRTLKCIQ